jgi:hypothetical protein
VSVPGAVVTAADLNGRWIAETIDGRDVSAWRDVSGLPANIIIGADQAANQWQVNLTCGPLIQGSFVLHADGSFKASVPAVPFQSCPSVSEPMPDLLGAIGGTAFVEVTESGGGRSLRFLNKSRQLVALWREDPTMTSRGSVCVTALGARSTAKDGAFTTVQAVRDRHLSGEKTVDDVFKDVPGGTVALYCVITGADGSKTYAVTSAGQVEPLVR